MTQKSDIPRISALLSTVGTILERDGSDLWDQTAEWERGPRQGNGHTFQRGGGPPEDEELDRDDQADRRADRRVARYHAEVKRLLGRLADDAARLKVIMADVCPADRQNYAAPHDDRLAPADVAADGWCRSCWRHDQHCIPIDTDRKGHRYYRDRCRFCGGFKADYGIDPPVELVRIKIDRSRNPTVTEVDEALERRGVKKRAS